MSLVEHSWPSLLDTSSYNLLNRITHTEVKALTLDGIHFEGEVPRERFWDFWGMMPSAARVIE